MTRASSLIVYISIALMGFLVLYLGATVYFCAGTLKGQIGGCASVIGSDVLRSPVAQALAVLSVSGLLLAQRIGGR